MHTEDPVNTEEPSPTREPTLNENLMQTAKPNQAQDPVITEESFHESTKEPNQSNFEDLFCKKNLKLPTPISHKRAKSTEVSQKTPSEVRFHV